MSVPARHNQSQHAVELYSRIRALHSWGALLFAMQLNYAMAGMGGGASAAVAVAAVANAQRAVV